MRRVLVLGAGKIGGAIVDLLGATGDWDVTVADQQQEFLALVDEERARTHADRRRRPGGAGRACPRPGVPRQRPARSSSTRRSRASPATPGRTTST